MCENKPLDKGLDLRVELADLQDQEDPGGRVVQNLQAGLGFRGVQGVPWDHHVLVDQMVLQEDPEAPVLREDRWHRMVPLVHRVPQVLVVPLAHQYLGDQEVEEVAVGVVVVVAGVEEVELENNMLLGMMEHSGLGSLADMDSDFFYSAVVVRVTTRMRSRRYK